MFLKWGHFSYRHRRIVPVIVIAAILAIYVIFGLRLGERMSQEGWDDPGSSSTAAAKIELETFGRDNNGDVILLYETAEGSGRTLNDPATFGAVASQLEQLKEQYPGQIDKITSYFDTRNSQLITADGTKAFAAIGLVGDGEQTLKDFRTIEDSLVSEQLPEGVTVQVAGATAVADALDDGMAGDIVRAEVVALPVVAILLLVVFGSVMAAFMPLLVGVLSIAGSLGILSILAGVAQVNVFAQSVVTLLGLGLAIDYGLFMVSRFREELDKGADIETAVTTTTATAGKTVVFSALMVAVALSGLLVFPQAFLKSVAYGAISAVGLAALLSVTVLPAVFGMLGRNIDKLSVRRASRKARRLEDTIWFRFPAWAMRHSKLVTVAIVGLLLALTLPLAGVKFGGINETYLPPDQVTRVAQDDFNESFPAFRTEPIKLVVTNASEQQLVDIYLQTREITGLSSPFTPDSGTVDGTTVLSAGIEDRSLNGDVVDQLRAITIPDGVNAYIGGTPAMEIESIEALMEKLPWMALYIIVATFILMALVFGSLILPAKAIIMTILGLGATLGILTAMFVYGVGSSLLNFTPGPLMSPVLVLIVAIVYGLSTDYEVFLVSRMVEARDRGDSTDDAIKYGTAHTGSIITAAALIMIVVAGAFGFSEIVMMKYIAFGMIAALALDATIIRMMLVPAVMHLLREDNWWAPGFIKKAYAKLGHGATVTPAVVDKPFQAPSAQDTAELSIHDAVIVDEQEAVRGGRTTRQDDELVPFAELLRRLQEDEQRQLEQ
ncbi:MMPL family transporter [Corynebacterium testudinoris]|uniref:Putative RND superfamily drug exporter n=1 Tax=Corynebacterium testudinoris TaxID=136857 RepID=A0A0G3HFF1_9CORY|nr:MMPL family transporter [Corynebacterium testudinoris]AKK09872.1 putative RND superfamily drug exporter [Corynebacterium testudinoris]MBX8996398.1 MMPL family transporter [Corynebacterium testudinoris]